MKVDNEIKRIHFQICRGGIQIKSQKVLIKVA